MHFLARVLAVKGKVEPQLGDMENPKLKTGAIEIMVSELHLRPDWKEA